MLHRPYIEQNTDEPSEQPLFFECFSCVMLRVNMMKTSADEPRYLCQILDVDNQQIEKENEETVNPAMKKPLKKCPIHGEVEES